MQPSRPIVGLVSVGLAVAVAAVFSLRLGGHATGEDGAAPAGCGGGAQPTIVSVQSDDSTQSEAYKPYIDAARAALAGEIAAAHVSALQVAQVRDDNAGTIRVVFQQESGHKILHGARAIVDLDADQTVKSKVAHFVDVSRHSAAVDSRAIENAASQATLCATCGDQCERCIDRGAQVVASTWLVVEGAPVYRVVLQGEDRDGATVERHCYVDALGKPACPTETPPAVLSARHD